MAEAPNAVKVCASCKAEKALTEFGQLRGKPRSYCKPCHAESGRKAYALHADKYMETRKQWRERNVGYFSKRREDPENRARENELQKARRESMSLEQRREINRECDARRREKKKAYRAANKERFSNYSKEWARNNQDKRAENEQRRRARKHQSGVITKVDRAAIIRRDKSTCYLCHRVLRPDEITLDHVLPLARGGSHTADNLRVACLSCNCRKQTKTLDELAAVSL